MNKNNKYSVEQGVATPCFERVSTCHGSVAARHVMSWEALLVLREVFQTVTKCHQMVTGMSRGVTENRLKYVLLLKWRFKNDFFFTKKNKSKNNRKKRYFFPSNDYIINTSYLIKTYRIYKYMV